MASKIAFVNFVLPEPIEADFWTRITALRDVDNVRLSLNDENGRHRQNLGNANGVMLSTRG